MLSACNLTATAPTPAATPDLPQVEFISPLNGATIFPETLLDIDIVAQDATAGITRIEFYVDGEMLEEGSPDSGQEAVFRVTMNWLTEGVGLHSLGVIAYRPDGTPSQETTIVVEVIARQ
jgi:hypothetical protein